MGTVKVRNAGAWVPAVESPAIYTSGTTTTTFARPFVAVYVDNDAGGWMKLTDLAPPPIFGVSITNNSGRIDMSWSVSSFANISKYQIYSSTYGSSGPYTLHPTEPTPTGLTQTFIYGRAPSAPITLYIFIRAVATNGLYVDSSVSSISIPGVTSWSALTYTYGAVGWHQRSFTFTSAAAVMGSTPKQITSILYRRASTADAWTYVNTYTDLGVSSHTKTFSFSSYTLGQQMFRVETTIEDTQTKQNDGSTGTGYTYSRITSLSQLSAADITGATPIVSMVANAVTNPGAPVSGTATGYDYGTLRSVSVTAGFSANAVNGEYTLVQVRLYDKNEVFLASIDLNLANILNKTVQATETVTFTGLARNEIHHVQVLTDDTVMLKLTTRVSATTPATYSGTWNQYTGTTTADTTASYNVGQVYTTSPRRGWDGDITAEDGFATADSYANLIDGNNSTFWLTNEVPNPIYNYSTFSLGWFYDYSTNTSTFQTGYVSYRLNSVTTYVPQEHSTAILVHSGYSGNGVTSGWQGTMDHPFDGAVTKIMGVQIDTGSRTLITNNEIGAYLSGTRTVAAIALRADFWLPKTYSGLINRFGLSEVSINTRRQDRYDNYETRTYYW